MNNKCPWLKPLLNEWSICGMNHYYINGKKQIFVSMTKDGRCITSEGDDGLMVWVNLEIQAGKIK